MVLLLYLALSTAIVSDRGVSFMRDEWRDPTITDFKVFYAAGGLVTDSHNRYLYYPGALPFSFPNAFRPAHANFFNPPLLALLYAPLTAFDIVGREFWELIHARIWRADASGALPRTLWSAAQINFQPA